jgi:hypothetical protein
MLAEAHSCVPHPSGLLPLYMARIGEYSGGLYDPYNFGRHLIIDTADVKWNEHDLMWAERYDVVPGDDVLHANAQRIRALVKQKARLDQELRVWSNEIHEKMLARLKEETGRQCRRFT